MATKAKTLSKIRKMMGLLAFTATLSACGSNADTPEPGEYQQSMKITTLELAGVEGDAKAEMIRQMEEAGNSVGTKFCMSAELGENQWKEAASQMTRLLGGDCETIRDGGSANILDLEMKCTGAAQGNVSVTMSGSARADGYESQMFFEIENPENGESNQLAMDIDAKRIGDCGA